jgi:hypothetical protein
MLNAPIKPITKKIPVNKPFRAVLRVLARRERLCSSPMGPPVPPSLGGVSGSENLLRLKVLPNMLSRPLREVGI